MYPDSFFTVKPLSAENGDVYSLSRAKSLPLTVLDELESKLIHFRDSSEAKEMEISWTISSETFPVYLFGRYKKLARDVPQSLWMAQTVKIWKKMFIFHLSTKPLAAQGVIFTHVLSMFNEYQEMDDLLLS
eukprot:gene20203-20760_t